MRGYLEKDKGNKKNILSKFKECSKKKKMTVMSIAIVVVLFVISGISAFADNIQTDLGLSGQVTNYIKLNTCKVVDTSKELTYVTDKENIPFVVVIKEDKKFLLNNSSANVWTPVELTQAQKMSFVRAVGDCVRKTVNTTVLTKDRVSNYNHAVNNINQGANKWVSPKGNSLVTKVGETTVSLSTTTNKLKVIDNSTDKNYKYVIYGSFKKYTAETFLQHGLTDATASDNVNPETDNDVCTQDTTDGTNNTGNDGANKASTKNYVAILDAGIHIPGAEFAKATNNNTATFIFAKKDKVVHLWTSCELTTSQKLSLTKQIQNAAKQVNDDSIKSVAESGVTVNFYGKNSSAITTEQFADYKVTNNNGKLSLSATEAAKMDWYCGGIFEFRDKSSDAVATLKDYRVDELKALQNNNEKNYVQINTAYLFNQNNTFDLTNSEENVPYIVVVNNGKVYIWTKTKLSDKQQESFLKVIEKTFYTIPVSGLANATTINTAVNNKAYSFHYSADNFGTSTIADVFDVKLANQKTLSVKARSGVTLDWYVAGYYKLSATEVNNGVTIEDKRQSAPTPTTTPTETPTEAPTAAPTQTPTPTQTPITAPTQTPNTPQTPVTDAPVTIIPTQQPQQPAATQEPQQGATVEPINQGGSNNGGDNQQVTEGEDQSGQKEESSTAVGNDSTPKTGDNANVVVYVILGILAVFGIAYFFILRKKITE